MRLSFQKLFFAFKNLRAVYTATILKGHRIIVDNQIWICVTNYATNM